MAKTTSITDLFIFPVKSLRGIAVKEALLTPTGLQWDRHWMIVKPNGGFITQRQFPQMVLIHTAITKELLVLSKQGMPDISIPLQANQKQSSQPFTATVWRDECEVVDEGEAVSHWLSEAIGTPKPVRLVRMADNRQRPQSKPELLGANTTTEFADAAPYLVCNQNSLRAVNHSLLANKHEAVTIEHFRPNIVINAIDAFAEHKVASLENDHYQFKHCYPCQRCVVPTINIETGIRHPQQQPFSLVSDLNSMPDNPKAPAFGENAILITGENQKITIGDQLTVNYKE